MMSRIKEHVFAGEENTPIFQSSNSDKVIGYIPKGSWMGIISQDNQRYQIISSRIDGWVYWKDARKINFKSRKIVICLDTSRIQYLIPRTELLAG